MIHAFRFKKNKLYRINLNKTESLSESIWIDLINPNNNERNRVQCELKHDLVTKPELEDIEASARFFENKDGLHIHSFFLYSDVEDRIGNTTVAFSIQNKKLFSLRERELPAFRLYRMRFRNKTINNNGNAYKILLDLFEIKIEQLADKIENICSDLESLSLVIMNNHLYKKKYDDALSTLAELEDVSWKVRLCLMDTQRALKFLIRRTQLPLKQLGQAKEVLRDIDSLLPHNESLFQKANFLLQAAMGFINIEQNRIIKIFSVVSVIFLPPTLVASSYGMNFEFMPELKWILGYPCAIILMILTGFAPYFYFKRKNWL